MLYILAAHREYGGHFTDTAVGAYSTLQLAQDAAQAVFPVREWLDVPSEVADPGEVRQGYPVVPVGTQTALELWVIYELEIDASPIEKVVEEISPRSVYEKYK